MKQFRNSLIILLSLLGSVVSINCPQQIISTKNIICSDPASSQLFSWADLGVTFSEITLTFDIKVSSYCSNPVPDPIRLATLYYGNKGSEVRFMDVQYTGSGNINLRYISGDSHNSYLLVGSQVVSLLDNWITVGFSFNRVSGTIGQGDIKGAMFSLASISVETSSYTVPKDMSSGMTLSLCSDIDGSPTAACQISNLVIASGLVQDPFTMALGRDSTLLVVNKFKEGSGYIVSNEGSIATSTYFGASTDSTQDNTKSPSWLSGEYGVKFTALTQYLTLPTYSHGLMGGRAGTASVGIYFWLKINTIPGPGSEHTIFSYNDKNLNKLYSIKVNGYTEIVCSLNGAGSTFTATQSKWIQIFAWFGLVDNSDLGYLGAYLGSSYAMKRKISPLGLKTTIFKNTDIVRFGGFYGQISDIRIYSPAPLSSNIASCSSTCPLQMTTNTAPICLQPVCGAFSYGSSPTCVNCPSTCATCTSTGVCQTCKVGYNLVNGACSTCSATQYKDNLGACQPCPTDCSSCTSPTSCQSCVAGKGIVGGVCGSCPTGTQLQNGYCSTCTSTQYVDTQGNCQACSNDCSSCTSSTSCQSCSAGKGFYGKVCDYCPSGTFLDASTGRCKSCPPYCDKCSSSSSCETCSLDYGLVKGICDICPKGTYRDSYTTACAPCPSTCETCVAGFSYTKCLTCLSGYNLVVDTCSLCPTGQYLDSYGNCQNCATNCLKCTGKNSCQSCASNTILTQGTCVGCPSGYYTFGDTCQPCISNCGECSGGSGCNKCKPGYYFQSLYNPSSCETCISNCDECSDQTACSTCSAGYYLQTPGKTCSPCLPNCGKCTISQLCQECKPGYALVIGGLACETCPPNCKSCLSKSVCLTCEVGYYLANSASTCASCSPNCEDCWNDLYCKKCKDGYNLKENMCIENGALAPQEVKVVAVAAGAAVGGTLMLSGIAFVLYKKGIFAKLKFKPRPKTSPTPDTPSNMKLSQTPHSPALDMNNVQSTQLGRPEYQGNQDLSGFDSNAAQPRNYEQIQL